MPLGDSITQGTNSVSTAGYRQFLWQALPSVRPVGTQTTNPPPLLSGQDKDHHEGHPGFTSGQIRDGLAGWLESVGGLVDAVLWHAGTNNLYESTVCADDMVATYQTFMAHNPSGIFFVAAPILAPRSTRADLYPFWQAQVAAVEGRVSSLPRAVPVSIPSSDADLSDDFHPQASGYEKMAMAWAAALAKCGVGLDQN